MSVDPRQFFCHLHKIVNCSFSFHATSIINLARKKKTNCAPENEQTTLNVTRKEQLVKMLSQRNHLSFYLEPLSHFLHLVFVQIEETFDEISVNEPDRWLRLPLRVK